MEKERLGRVLVIQAAHDFHFRYVFLEVEDRLQRFFGWVTVVVVIHLHGERVAIAGDRPALLLDVFLDMKPGSVVNVSPFEKAGPVCRAEFDGNVRSVLAPCLVHPLFFPKGLR